jgi:PIN domain nuclease of toxin-antitoxin system
MASAWELKEGYTISTLNTPHGGLSYSSQELNEIELEKMNIKLI